MDFSRLRMGEIIAGGSGVILLIVMLALNWYSVDIPAVPKGVELDTSVNAFQAFEYTDIVLVLTALVAIAFALLTASQRTVAVPVATSVLAGALGLFSTLLLLYRIINQPGPNEIVGVDLGAYVGLAAVAGIAVGGFMAMRDDGPGLGGGTGPDATMMPPPPRGVG